MGKGKGFDQIKKRMKGACLCWEGKGQIGRVKGKPVWPEDDKSKAITVWDRKYIQRYPVRLSKSNSVISPASKSNGVLLKAFNHMATQNKFIFWKDHPHYRLKKDWRGKDYKLGNHLEDYFSSWEEFDLVIVVKIEWCEHSTDISVKLSSLQDGLRKDRPYQIRHLGFWLEWMQDATPGWDEECRLWIKFGTDIEFFRHSESEESFN